MTRLPGFCVQSLFHFFHQILAMFPKLANKIGQHTQHFGKLLCRPHVWRCSCLASTVITSGVRSVVTSSFSSSSDSRSWRIEILEKLCPGCFAIASMRASEWKTREARQRKSKPAGFSGLPSRATRVGPQSIAMALLMRSFSRGLEVVQLGGRTPKLGWFGSRPARMRPK